MQSQTSNMHLRWNYPAIYPAKENKKYSLKGLKKWIWVCAAAESPLSWESNLDESVSEAIG